MITLFSLLVVFQLKHFLADYLLQNHNRYMLGKFLPDWGFVKPLAAHCGIHAALTFLIAAPLVAPILGLVLAIFDGVTHFGIDRAKAGPNWLGRYNDKGTPIFWDVLGLDQMMHHLVHYAIIFVIALVLY